MFETGQVFHMIRRASVSVGIAASLGLATGVSPIYASDEGLRPDNTLPAMEVANRRNGVHQHFA